MKHAAAIKTGSTSTRTKHALRARGQIQGQVLIYILTILVVGLLVFMGARWLGEIMRQGCDAQEISLKTEIENALRSYVSKRSVNDQNFDAPCSYTELCVVDTQVILRDPAVTLPATFPSSDRYALVKGSAEAQVKRNIFLLDSKGTVSSRNIYVETARVADPSGMMCIKSLNGRFHLRFIGLGRESQVMDAKAAP